MTTRIAIRAHAKLNLWLRVLAREASGYHSIETLFHKLELHDDVVVALAADGERTITCSSDVGPDRANLAFRAAELFCESMDWQTGFHIEITKRIPASGGLGGGSADAAATLLALNAVSPRRRDESELCALGAKLGADIPFLVTNALMALAWGRGDRILKLPALPQRHVALVVPSFGISTADAYGSLPEGFPRASDPLSTGDLADWGPIARLSRNDLSDSAIARSNEQLSVATEALRAARALIAGMTGSGSVLFGIFESEPDAGALEKATGCQVILTRTALNVEGPTRLD